MLKPLLRTLIALLILLAACSPAATPAPVIEEAPLPTGVFDTLAPLGLSGRLIFIEYADEGGRLMQLDLATGELAPLFTPPANAYLGAADVSPDGSQIVLAYAPPPEPGKPQFAYTDLVLLPTGGGDPAPLLTRRQPNEFFGQPAFSPDGAWIYYTYTIPTTADGMGGLEVRIERVPVDGAGGGSAGGEKAGDAEAAGEVVVPRGKWPRLSPDGAQMAFLSVDETLNVNELYLASADGADPQPVFRAGEYPAVDAHTFSPDGQFIYFSTVNPVQTSAPGLAESAPAAGRAAQGQPGPLARLLAFFAARPVSAHDGASDVYRVELSTGTVHRMTYLDGTGVYATFSPDGSRVAVINDRGVFIMDPDGKNLVQVAGLAAGGSVNWVE